MDQSSPKRNTVMGIDENVEALLVYVLGWVTGLIFLLLEKENQFVRFHAVQSLATFLSLTVLTFVLSFIPLIGPLFNLLIGPCSLILWVVLMVQAFQGNRFKLPVVGTFAEEQVAGKSA